MKTTLILSVFCAAMAVTAALTCGSALCASDEVCSKDGTACQCDNNAYKNTADKPSPNVTCSGGNFNILVSKCWLEKNHYNTTNIRLNSGSCLAQREIVNGTAQMGIHQPLNTCGSISTTNSTHVTYANKLYIFGTTIPVQSKLDVIVNIACTFPLAISNISLNFPLNSSIGTTVINIPGSSAAFTVKMLAYTDPAFTNLLTDSSTLYVEDTIYISVVIPDLDASAFSTKVLRIYAIGDSSNAIPIDLLVNGCPAPGVAAGLLSVLGNGNGIEARFSLKVFQITGSTRMRLLSDLKVCAPNCVENCQSLSRSSDSDGSTATVSIILEPSQRYDDGSSSSASGFSMPQTLPALFFSWILVKLM